MIAKILQICYNYMRLKKEVSYMRIVLLGAPGCGKGTQAPLLAKKYGIPHISTGAIFRAALADKTELGVLAKQYMDEGKLVPDTITIGLVKERLSQPDCKKGYILDGFPRNVHQAEKLATFGNVDACVYFEISMETLAPRITGRRVCEKCGATYHISTHPSETCDVCHGHLIQRADDSLETFTKRMSVYEKETAPLIDFYQKHGLLKTINANQSVDEVSNDIVRLLGENHD